MIAARRGVRANRLLRVLQGRRPADGGGDHCHLDALAVVVMPCRATPLHLPPQAWSLPVPRALLPVLAVLGCVLRALQLMIDAPPSYPSRASEPSGPELDNIR